MLHSFIIVVNFCLLVLSADMLSPVLISMVKKNSRNHKRNKSREKYKSQILCDEKIPASADLKLSARL